MLKLQSGLPAVIQAAIHTLTATVILVFTKNTLASSLPIIVISPDWREVDQQVSPSTVSNFSEQQLDAAGVQNTHELQAITPGMTFTTNAGLGQAYLRGIGGQASAAGSARVATFIDGVYLPRTAQSMQEFFDIKRVEVIKGPHGVHLGRNVVGGAISMITQDPVPYREAYADILYGSSDQQVLRGAVNTPVSDDLSFRLSGLLAQHDGYSHNIFRDEDIDDQGYYGWRGKLRYQPSNKLDVIFSVEQNRQDDTRSMAKQPDPDIGINGGILLGGFVPENPREVTHNLDQNQQARNSLYHAKITWNTDDIELRSITAYQDTMQNNASDLDGTDVDFASSFPASNADVFSQELRFSSRQHARLGWVAGVYLSKEDATLDEDLRLPLLSVQSLTSSSSDKRSYALFGELDYKFTEKWQGRAGVRYNHDEASIDMLQTRTNFLGISIEQFQDSHHWQAVTPEFGINYIADTDTFYYAKVSRGYKAGGYNAASIQAPYDPEFMWSYELGIKADVPTQLLRVNASLFYYDYKDMQLPTLPPDAPTGTLPVITNAAKSVIKGIDLQVWYQPVADFEVMAGATLLDAYYKEFNSVDPNNPANDPDHSGEPLPNAPDVSLVLGATYLWPDLYGGDFRLSANYKYQSAVYYNAYHDEATRQESYGLLNANLGFSSYNSRWYAELFGNNLTDKLYAQNIIRVDPVLGTARYWGEPRTFGIRLGYKI